MTKKKKLKREVRKLEAEVKTADAKAARWKKRAKRQKAAAESSAADVATLRKKLKAARRAAESDAVPVETPAVAEVSPVEAEQPAVSPESATPDDTWTVTALRTEARSRGLAGYSRKSKADLLAELT